MSSPLASPTHYLVITYPSWAHTRSVIGLSCALQHLNPHLYLTILVPSSRSAAAALEFAQYPPLSEPSRRVIVHYGEHGQVLDGMWNPRGEFRAQSLAELPVHLQGIVELTPLTDPLTGERVEIPKIPLTAIISDSTLVSFAREVETSTRAAYPDRPAIRVLGFAPYNVAFVTFLLLDGYGNFWQRCNTIMDQAGDDEAKRAKLTDELISSNGDLVELPGLWPFYMYEANPVPKESVAHRVHAIGPLGKMLPNWVDGIIVGWPSIYTRELHQPMAEKIGVELIEQFGAFYAVGFQLPAASADEWTVEYAEGECHAYLDAAAEHKTVIYISFGSAIYAPTREQLVVLLDVLESLSARYIMAEGNAPPETKAVMRARIGKGRDRGLLVAWAPQRAILSHPATGLFLTHGGSNSAMESMLFKVPMLMWPSGFDQPYIANELDKLGVAIELLQIRGGPNIGKPIARSRNDARADTDTGVSTDTGIVIGTPEALATELSELFGLVKGVQGRTDEGERIAGLRRRLSTVGEEVKRDRESGGAAAAVRELAFMRANAGASAVEGAGSA